jgi:putative hemolysin
VDYRRTEEERVVSSRQGCWRQWSSSVGSQYSRPVAESSAYQLRFADSAEELEKLFRLRFTVFNLESGEGLESAYRNGGDTDEFDAVCDHWMVEHRGTGEVVGTYRLQTGRVAAANLGYYSKFRTIDFLTMLDLSKLGATARSRFFPPK